MCCVSHRRLMRPAVLVAVVGEGEGCNPSLSLSPMEAVEAECNPSVRLVRQVVRPAVVVSRYQAFPIPPMFVLTNRIIKTSPAKKNTPPTVLQMTVIHEKMPPGARI